MWAACAITALATALLFTIVIACGVARQQRKKLIDLKEQNNHVQVTQRESAPTQRQGTAIDMPSAIKKMNDGENMQDVKI